MEIIKIIIKISICNNLHAPFTENKSELLLYDISYHRIGLNSVVTEIKIIYRHYTLSELV